MKTALRAIGYSAVVAGGFALILAIWMAVLVGASELAIRLGASPLWAPLYGLGAWGVIACTLIGTSIAIAKGEEEKADATA